MAKEKVVEFELNKDLVRKLAMRRADNGDYVGALDFLMPLLNGKGANDVMLDVADIYREMDEFELSNRYIFKYMSKTGENNLSSVYEDLAINHFYLDRYDVASYYLKKKLDEDGFLDRELLDQEILEYYSGNDGKDIKLVYPPELADYEEEYKEAVKEMASGNFEGAIYMLSQIPKGSKDYLNAVDKIAYAYYLMDDLEKALYYSKEMIKLKGDSVLAYCHLTNIYSRTRNNKKSDFYYAKAKSCEIKDNEEVARLAVCALDKKDGEFACSLMEKLLKDKEYSCDLLIYYGQALVNTDRWEKAREVFSKAYRIDNGNHVAKYYLKFTERLLDGDKNAKSKLPISFSGDIPEFEYEKMIDKLMALNAQSSKAFTESLKKKEIQEMFSFGVESKNPTISEACVFTLFKSQSPFSVKLLKECLLLDGVDIGLKRAIVYNLAYNGQNKIALTVHGRFNRIKVGDIGVSKGPEELVFFSGYVSALAFLSVTPFDNYLKLRMLAKIVYTDLVNDYQDLTADEIGALIVYLLKFGKVSTKQSVCKCFGIKRERFNQVYELYKKRD